jgi:hypothetical protein
MGSGGIVPSFLTLALDGDEWSASWHLGHNLLNIYEIEKCFQQKLESKTKDTFYTENTF